MDRESRLEAGYTMFVDNQLSEGDPKKAIDRLLEDLVGSTSALSGCVYYLSFSKSQFRVESVFNRDGRAPALDFHKLNRIRERSDGELDPSELLAQVVVSERPVIIDDFGQAPKTWWHHQDARSLVACPIMREKNCVGMIELDSDRADSFGVRELEVIKASTVIARLLFEKAEALQLFESLQQPIDFTIPFTEFVAKQVELAVLATDMPYVALREWDGEDTLECLGAYGFHGLQESSLNLVGLEDYPFFLKALQQEQTSTVNKLAEAEDDSIKNRPELSNVRSYMVAPIRVGDGRVFGTLSCAAECSHNYSELEKRGLETIANAIGVAILNYRNASSHSDEIAEHTKIGAAMTAVEVAQAARHEARNALAQASARLTRIYNECQKSARVDGEKVLEHVEEIVGNHQAVDRSLDKIKQITKPPARELEQVSVKDLWKQAFGLVNGRLDELRVNCDVTGPDFSIYAYPEYLRHAFLNLALNSIDAYRDLRRRRDRFIKVYIDAQSASSNKIRMRYVDNATGIDLARLGPKEVGNVLSVNDIFKAGVTAKPDGSGFGLYLVRQITIDHDGSIELKDSKNGVTFEISISKELRPN